MNRVTDITIHEELASNNFFPRAKISVLISPTKSHLYFSLALVLFVFFPHSFLLFPFLLRYFFLFFVIFATFPHRHIFPQLFPYNLCLTDLRTVWQPRFQVWEFEVKCGVVTNNLHCLLQHFYVICPRIGINSSTVVVDY
jgi:hypothetical protein